MQTPPRRTDFRFPGKSHISPKANILGNALAVVPSSVPISEQPTLEGTFNIESEDEILDLQPAPKKQPSTEAKLPSTVASHDKAKPHKASSNQEAAAEEPAATAKAPASAAQVTPKKSPVQKRTTKTLIDDDDYEAAMPEAKKSKPTKNAASKPTTKPVAQAGKADAKKKDESDEKSEAPLQGIRSFHLYIVISHFIQSLRR